MNKELRQTIGGVLIFLAVAGFFALLFVPNLYKHLEKSGYEMEEATRITGIYGTICLLGAILCLCFGLGFINKWLPTIILATWYAHKYARSDGEEDDEDY